MNESARIDFSKLLGFELLSDEISAEFDFQDQTVSARLGAKVGIEVTTPALPPVKSAGGEKN
jgi:hypothetical protein